MDKSEEKLYNALLKAAIAIKMHVNENPTAHPNLKAVSVGLMNTNLSLPITLAMQEKQAMKIAKMDIENDKD